MRLVVLGVFLVAAAVAAPSKPHVLFVLVDDLGWGNVGFHREQATPEVATPAMDALVKEGIQLNRHYVHKFCTPTRTAVQSGRLPVHVNTNLKNPEEPNCGIPRNMTGMAVKMKQAGYRTHFAGKWDAGMATPMHTPHGRGYESSLIYFSHKNNYWTEKEMQSSCPDFANITDYWRDTAPAYGENGTGVYEEFLFHSEVESVIRKHDPEEPLFMFYAPHIVHCPLQVPKAYYDKFSFMTDDEPLCRQQSPYIYPGQTETWKCRQVYHAMVNLLDDILANVTSQLKERGMWENTLMVLSADNGGPLTLAESGANNYPLKGGKYSFWEGGIRAASFVSGGALPEKMRGTQLNEIISIADWYSTFVEGLGGVDPTDTLAAQSGLPPIDSLNMWPLLKGEVTKSPRTEIPLSPQHLISGDFKLMLGSQPTATHTGPHYPNSTSSSHDPEKVNYDCGSSGCLYNVATDPLEMHDLASEDPHRLATMRSRLDVLQKSFYSNNDTAHDLACPAHVAGDRCACWLAFNHYGGFFGPFEEISMP